MRQKIKLIVEFEGSAYHGWQVQPNGITVQEVLQSCLQKITKKKTTVISSGRTDAGVHAEAMPAHFITDSKMSEREFMKAFNSLLPHDIVVKDVAFVPMDFDARRSATKKTYRYTILNRDYPAALFYRRCMFVPFSMDIPGMRRAKQYLVGEHDFSAFRASNCEAKNPIRKIHKIDLIKKGDFIYLIFEGNGFLKHMVRNLVGTLVEVGRRRMKAAEVRSILESRDRNRAGPTAQPQGLCLVNVVYPKQKLLGRRKNK